MASNQRDLHDVIGLMLEKIPEGTYLGLRSKLQSIQYSVAYAAPELHGMWWQEAQDALIDYTGAPEHAEIQKILGPIWNGVEE